MKILRLLPLAFLTHCAAPSNTTLNDDVTRQLSGDLFVKESPALNTTSGITVPILRAPELESKYGKPQYHVMADGSYISHLNAGEQNLTITGTARPVSKKGFSQPGDTSMILGQSVGNYNTGNDTGAITTDPVRLTAPDGRAANYVISVENNSDTKKPVLPKLDW